MTWNLAGEPTMLECFGFQSTGYMLLIVYAVLSGFMSGLILSFSYEISVARQRLVTAIDFTRPILESHSHENKEDKFVHSQDFFLLEKWVNRIYNQVKWLSKVQFAIFALGGIILVCSVITLGTFVAFPMVTFSWLAGGAFVGVMVEKALSIGGKTAGLHTKASVLDVYSEEINDLFYWGQLYRKFE
jgi:hypothetical protein